MLTIKNNGQAIAATNYWDSAHARAGYCYLSWNAGAGRLLLPTSQEQMLSEMRGAALVIVSRGPWADHGGRDALELLFEDGSDAPFCIHLVAEQCDRLVPDDDQGGGVIFAVWTPDGKKLQLPCKYRVVGALPCLQPWIDH